ncbi:hypothetical protein [Streptomyces sp. ADMS]|uniref:hypothetical protein n=1 Tax=Streptomyces sp. ADMS TaxID=3071415 RepID=UPI00399130F8
MRGGRRHRGGGVPSRTSGAAAEDGVDRPRRPGRALRDEQRGRTRPHGHLDKIVVDDWGQAHAGPFGALRAHVDSGRLNKADLHGELGEIVAGRKPGRASPAETNLFWHRGLSLSDIALGAAMLRKAEERGLGQKLRFS